MPRLFLTLFFLAAASFVAANNPYFVHCEKGGCDSCTTSSCEPGDSTYVTSATFRTDKGVSSYLSDMEQRGYVCSVKEILPYSGDGTNPDGSGGGGGGGGSGGGGGGGGGGSPGVTAASYSRASILFSGVTPDYVRSETIGGKRLPKQLPIKNATRIYSDLPDGFQVAQYTNSSLSDRAADGMRSVPAGAQPSAITMYKNPDGGTTTSTGRLDIVHKQRHPQSGAWITRTIRKTAPQGENNWKTEFFLGDPTEPDAIPIQSYREITITRTPNADGTESTREITRDRATDGSLVITSDISATYAFYKFGEPVKISETRHTGTASELTVTTTYHTDSHKPVSYNKPATIRRSDGSWENISYQGSLITGTIVTKTVSGWLDNPAPAAGEQPDEASNRVVTEIEAFNETGTFSRVEKIQGVTVSNSWGERFKDKSGMVVEKSHVETGSARLTTLSHRFSNDVQFSAAERGKLKSVQYPDGTVETHSYTAQGDNILTTTDRGVGSISAVTDGTRTLSVHIKQDILIKETVTDISSGITLSAREAIAFDSNNQPTRCKLEDRT